MYEEYEDRIERLERRIQTSQELIEMLLEDIAELSLKEMNTRVLVRRVKKFARLCIEDGRPQTAAATLEWLTDLPFIKDL